jgi:hypothetical protein
MAMERFAFVAAHRNEMGGGKIEVVLGNGDAEDCGHAGFPLAG